MIPQALQPCPAWLWTLLRTELSWRLGFRAPSEESRYRRSSGSSGTRPRTNNLWRYCVMKRDETWTKYFTIWNAQERISHRAFNHSAYYSHFVRYSKERTLQSYGMEKRYFDIFLSQGTAIAMKTHMLLRQAHIKVVKMRSRNTLDNIRSKDLQM